MIMLCLFLQCKNAICCHILLFYQFHYRQQNYCDNYFTTVEVHLTYDLSHNTVYFVLNTKRVPFPKLSL